MTFQFQTQLPRLPVPSLTATATTYLDSIKACSTESEFQKTKKYVEDFIAPGGLGEILQQRLIERDKAEQNSWLEKWWLQLAYHGWRESVLINSNWYIITTPDQIPKHLLTLGDPSRKNGEITQIQIQRTATVISKFLDYKELIDS